MKIIYIYGNMTHYDHGLGELLKRTHEVFSELDAQTETVDLGVLHPPYYDGETTNAIDGVMEKIKAADGVVLACTAQNFAPTALMQSFLEYLQEYTEIICGKHFMVVTLSEKGGEKSACDYLTRVVEFFGGFVVASVGLNAKNSGEKETGEFIDKTTQDFYRAVHQKRKYVIPTDFIIEKPVAKKIEEPPREKPKPETKPLGFTDTQEKEIEELSLLFTKMHTKGENSPAGEINESVLTDAPSNPFAPTASEKRFSEKKSSGKKSAGAVKNLTQRLPEFFNSQLSSGLQAVIQFNITGNETFDGAIRIHSTECTYIEGTVPAPDIIIMADATIWLDVLKNKNTAQKAFMTGGIKVRGDFVLLSKFDSLFEFPK